VIGVLTALAAPTPAHAQATPYSLRGTLGAALLITKDQVGRLGFDHAGLALAVHGAREVVPWLELRAGVHGGAFWASEKPTGGLLAFTGGVLLQRRRPHVPVGATLRPYLALDFGFGVTGTLVRPYLLLTAGLDVQASKHLELGPAVGYGRLIQWNGPEYTTDAGYLWFGLLVCARRAAEPLPPPRPIARAVRRVAPEPRSEPPAEPSVDVIALIERSLPSSTKRVELLAPVLFRFDSDQLEPLGIAMLYEVASTLGTRPDIRLLQIQGYTDDRGSPGYNHDLSQRRAERVRCWLVEHGVAAERLTTEPRGASDLLEHSHEESAHTQNRRVIFRVLETSEP